ncbi:11213_t:CDS:2 [Funneliformis geosporum]|uniref:11213_t:CDS:1 n=1 Tax=Funneliformis geosporum TaxID=1117311 RepID=A0A9W4WUX0_9GLOM|nr:11213_t:CDS:2 [Funneliformis geosporum]
MSSSYADRMSRSLFVSGLSRRTTIEDLETAFKEFGRLKDVYIPRDYYTREPRGFAYIEYYDERDCDEAYRHGTVILHGRELTVEFARGSRKTPREMRGKDNRYSPIRRGRYGVPKNSYRPRSRVDYRRYDDEEDNRRSNKYSRSRSYSRSSSERHRRLEQVNGHPKSRSRTPDFPPTSEMKDETT